MSKDEGKFARLGEQQKWEWHADVYAFRHVVLGAALDDPTPCDGDRQWYSEALVRAAVSRKLAKRDSARQQRREAVDRSTMLEGRAAINGWAREQGCADIDAYALAKGIDWLEAYRQGMGELMAQAIARRTAQEPRHRRRPLDDIRRDLGLPAREEPIAPAFVPSPESLAAGRRALGLEPETT